jgi:hypothetical protein
VAGYTMQESDSKYEPVNNLSNIANPQKFETIGTNKKWLSLSLSWTMDIVNKEIQVRGAREAQSFVRKYHICILVNYYYYLLLTP